MELPTMTSMADQISPYLNSTVAGLLFLLLLFSYFVLKKATSRNRRSQPPEVAGGWPIIGHLRLLSTNSQLLHETLGGVADKYGPIFGIRIGVRQALVISSWEVATECYTTLDSIVSSRPKIILQKKLGYNFAGFGFRPHCDSFYRNMRKIVASEALSNRRLELQRDIRVSEVKRSVKEVYNLWAKTGEASSDSYLVLDLDEWIGNIALNVILMMVCGKRFVGGSCGDEREMERCRKAMRGFFDLGGKFIVGDAIPFLKWLDLGGYQKATNKVWKELDCLMEEWLEEHRRKKRDCSDADADGEHDLMAAMPSLLEGLDLAGYDADTVNKATCLTLISGGTDTMAVTLTWAISLLLNNQEALRKVEEELDIHVGKERVVDESDISKLVYLQAVIKETLRLYPAGPLSGAREVTQDCTIGGYNVAAGTYLITNIWKIQRDPRIWQEPSEFKPERFLSSHKHMDVKGQHFELSPFGYGRRACPGQGISLLMTPLVLASLIHSFQLRTRCDEAVDMTANLGLTMHRVNPLQVLVKPRLLPTAYA
ncbi:cytochrome P450 CYP82D47-like [Cucurbita pepo subsp. pepo]|uniref:cytochrome P450 CYP82D47-like n=1 Tax=Cucurbita pepo subsp. pepo TaxID=3664 RepID=UPI000C9D6DA6|nr:cytochrome P450 CYP82D47-like [Cucurbita pepo subsp. pepo]